MTISGSKSFFFNFMHCLWKIGQNNRLVLSLLRLIPSLPSGKSWIRHCWRIYGLVWSNFRGSLHYWNWVSSLWTTESYGSTTVSGHDYFDVVGMLLFCFLVVRVLIFPIVVPQGYRRREQWRSLRWVTRRTLTGWPTTWRVPSPARLCRHQRRSLTTATRPPVPGKSTSLDRPWRWRRNIYRRVMWYNSPTRRQAPLRSQAPQVSPPSIPSAEQSRTTQSQP